MYVSYPYGRVIVVRVVVGVMLCQMSHSSLNFTDLLILSGPFTQVSEKVAEKMVEAWAIFSRICHPFWAVNTYHIKLNDVNKVSFVKALIEPKQLFENVLEMCGKERPTSKQANSRHAGITNHNWQTPSTPIIMYPQNMSFALLDLPFPDALWCLARFVYVYFMLGAVAISPGKAIYGNQELGVDCCLSGRIVATVQNNQTKLNHSSAAALDKW